MVEPQYPLETTIVTVKQTVGENELVSSKLVFETNLRFFILSTNLPTQKQQMEAIRTTQTKMSTTVAQRKSFEALTRNIPFESNHSYEVEEEALVWSELKKKWIGLLVVIGVEGRMVNVENKYSMPIKTFNSFQAKSFCEALIQNFHVYCFIKA